MKKKLLGILLALAMVLPCLPAAAAQENNWAGEDGVIKVLAIGNSFTMDSFYYFNQVEKAQDPDDQIKIVFGYLYKGGIQMHDHANNAVNNVPDYIYYKYDRTVSDSWVETPNATVLTGVKDEDWDLISIQYSTLPPIADDTGLDELVDFIKQNKTNPKAKLGRHVGWAYADGYRYTGPHKEEFAAAFQNDPQYMYRYTCDRVKECLETRADMEFAVPSATTIQNLRAGIFGDNLQRDYFHLNPFGRTMVSYTWYAFLTGKLESIKLTKSSSWNPSEYERAAMIEAINNALANPYEVTPPTITAPDPRPVYFVLEARTAEGGEVKAYDVTDPTKTVTVKYTGTKNSSCANVFCRLNDDGVLDAQTLFGWMPTAAYHNYFQSYDAEQRVMILADGTAAMGGHTGTASCGFTCTPSTKSGGRELSYYVLNVPVTTPVVDVSGEDHGLKTLQDIIDLSATHRIRMNHYSSTNTAPAILFVDEVVRVEVPAYELQEGDVIFIPGTASKGASCDAYIMKSATATVGDKVSVTIPDNANKATGNRGNTVGRFWEMLDGQLRIINGMWYNHEKQGDPALTPHRYGYHDKLADYGDDYLLLEQHPDHLGGGKKCAWSFPQACGDAESRGRECAARLKTGSTLTILDLRASVLAGTIAPISKKGEIYSLCKKTDDIMINTFVPDGTKEDGTAAVVIVLDARGTLTRAEVVQTLYEKAGKPAVTPKVTFTDVPADSAYYNAVSWAANKKYVAGYGDGTFGADDPVTVEQLAVILWHYLGHPEDAVALDQIGAHSRWALQALHWAVAKKVFAGVPYDQVGDVAPRVETVKMLADYLK